jgi:hypothetical protein
MTAEAHDLITGTYISRPVSRIPGQGNAAGYLWLISSTYYSAELASVSKKNIGWMAHPRTGGGATGLVIEVAAIVDQKHIVLCAVCVKLSMATRAPPADGQNISNLIRRSLRFVDIPIQRITRAF